MLRPADQKWSEWLRDPAVACIALHAVRGPSWWDGPIVVPPAWVGLVHRPGRGYSTVASGESLEIDGKELAHLVRTTELLLEWQWPDLPAAGGAKVEARVTLRAHILPELGDLISFVNATDECGAVVSRESLLRLFEAGAREAIAERAREKTLVELAEAGVKMEIAKAVEETIRAKAFTLGLEITAPPRLEIGGLALERMRRLRQDAALHEEEKALREKARASQKAEREVRLAELGTVLDRIEALRRKQQGLGLKDLLHSFDVADRADLFCAYLRREAAGMTTRWIIVAVSNGLILLDPKEPTRIARRIALEGAPGAVRSVQSLRGLILVGAAMGVYSIRLNDFELEREYVVNEPEAVRGGFNAAALGGDDLVASHSELGLRRWSWADAEPRPPLFPDLTAGARAVRAVRHDAGRFYAAVDQRILVWPPERNPAVPEAILNGAKGLITALAVGAPGIFAGTAEGDLLHWRSSESPRPEVIVKGRGRAIESLHILGAEGLYRLGFSDTSIQFYERIVGEPWALEYSSGGTTLRRVEMASDLLVATNEMRDRLVLFHVGECDHPVATVNVGQLTGHAIQDVCLAASSSV